ncbi:hypothetical protein PVK06_027671 [Gossypium arboreum]|uniref:Uncharacterized protein n=1 Tax=Gossypium arboreum TaxID=29729 RepID=A0ABR0P2A1_GOSAR|nr:hypothetical protein PVK06_027671 [Gossypium arboreum]
MKKVGPSHIGLGQQGNIVSSPWHRELTRSRSIEDSGLGITMGHRGASPVDLDIWEEAGAASRSLGQCGLNGKSPLVIGLDHISPLKG